MSGSALVQSERSSPSSTRGLIAEVVEVVVLALGLYLVITFAVQTVHVLGLSMVPTLNDQDYLIATKIDYRLHDPARGDIVIMRDPYDSSKDFIKRVIGLPGEQILIRDGQVFINGQRVDEPYLRKDEPWTTNANWPPPGTPGAGAAYTIPRGEYFVMGDNRNASSDSRIFGAVQRDRIEAHAWLRIWPFNQFGPVTQSRPTLVPATAAAA
jgi:signal peptidase I